MKQRLPLLKKKMKQNEHLACLDFFHYTLSKMTDVTCFVPTKSSESKNYGWRIKHHEKNNLFCLLKLISLWSKEAERKILRHSVNESAHRDQISIRSKIQIIYVTFCFLCSKLPHIGLEKMSREFKRTQENPGT